MTRKQIMEIPIVDVERLGNGWYSFEKIPQNGYIKVHALNCGTDVKASNMARKLMNSSNASVCFI